MRKSPRAGGESGEFEKVAETNHRIANHLAMLSGLVNLQARRLRADIGSFDPEAVLAIFASLEAKLQAVARLHRALSRPERPAGETDLAGYLGDVVTMTVASLADPGSIDLSLEIEPDCRIDVQKALHVALITCEIVTNSIKYAHPTGVSGRLMVSCRRRGAELALDIEDDGVGLPPDLDPLADGNVGFRVVRSLVAELGGAMIFTSNELGLAVSLKLPLCAATGDVVYIGQVSAEA